MSALSEQLKKFLPAAGDNICDNLKKAAQFELEWIKFLKTIFLDADTFTDEFISAYCALGCAEDGSGTTTPGSTTTSTTTSGVFPWALSSTFLYGIPIGLACDETGEIITVTGQAHSSSMGTLNRGTNWFGWYAVVGSPVITSSALSVNRDNSFTLVNLYNPTDGATRLRLAPHNGGGGWSSTTNLNFLDIVGSTISNDGTKIAIIPASGFLKTSTDSGANFTNRDSSRTWRGICGSDDGVNLAAYALTGFSTGKIYTSDDSGVTWTERATAGTRAWSRIRCSADGLTIIACVDGSVAAQVGGVYVSTDGGDTWVEKFGSELAFRDIACSADGQTIVAAPFNNFLYVSTDGGDTWVPQDEPRPWQLVCCNSAGDKMAAFATGESRLRLGPA